MCINKRFFSSHVVKTSKTQQIEKYLCKQNLEFLVDKKDVLLDRVDLKSSPQNLILKNSKIFLKTSKLIKFRRLLSSNKNDSILSQKKFQTNFFFDLTIVNTFINKAMLPSDYNFFTRYQHALFSKNFNLFLDLIKVTNLLCQNIVHLKLFVALISTLFRTLHKRQHNRFIFFISNLFKYILETYPNVLGLRLEINGRLMGKPRASTIKIEYGFLGLNSFSSKRYSYQNHVYTLYGAFGFKCYINFKNNNKI